MTVDLILIVLALAILALQAVLLLRRPAADTGPRFDALDVGLDRLGRDLRDELARARSEAAESARRDRDEQAQALGQFARNLASQLGQLGEAQTRELTGFAQQLALLTQSLDERLDALRRTVDEKLQQAIADARAGREESGNTLRRFGEALNEQLTAVGTLLKDQLVAMAAESGRQLGLLTQGNEQKLESLRTALNERLAAIQQDNAAKLEEMRKTVDEKLHATLEQRLGESFKLVSDRLEQVHRGLGEMQTLAAGVGDLKRVLTNVKTRGTWGEVQLEAMLEQIMTPEQYGKNVATRPKSADRVEFAIRLPGRDIDDRPVWLPIDAKFPVEDYQRLTDAQERVDPVAVEEAGKALENRLKLEAKTIREKYVEPPHTTDFAILYLPIEGLYAEALRRPGLADTLQREHRVSLAGPTTLAAMLNSLQMGFRTLAIEKRSSEVWTVLGAVKTEFGKFGEALAHTKKKLEEATSSIGKAETRTRVLSRKLKEVEALPATEATLLLGADEPAESVEADEAG